MKIKIAFLQIESTGNIDGNLKKGIQACRQARDLGADIALFPEMWSCGYSFPHETARLKECAISANNPFVKQFAELSAELDMAIAITFLEQHEPKPRNTVCLFDCHGNMQYCYSKVHICDFGEADDEGVLDAGENFFVADLDTKKGTIKVGSMICYDREFPECARILMLKDAELILVPNACPMEQNRLAQLRGRTYENMLAIATCNYPGSHPDCNGHSTLFDGVIYLPNVPGSRDTCVFEAGEEEDVYMAELDVDTLRDYRHREVWGRKNRRPELYGEIAEIHKRKRMLTIYEPQPEDLWFKQRMMSDEKTMSYNHAYGGTIPFPEEQWAQWYDRWITHSEGKRYYRYLKDDSGAFVGEISWHYDDKKAIYLADVLILSDYRGRGYGGAALEMLCSSAKEHGISVLYDDIASDNPAIGMFLKHGFTEEYRTEQIVMLKKDLRVLS